MPALFLILLSAYYARKYAGIIDAGLICTYKEQVHLCIHCTQHCITVYSIDTCKRCACNYILIVHVYMFLMRDEKEERRKQARSNKQTRQRNTAHPRQSLFPRKNELPQVGLEPTTLYTLDRALYQLSYRGSSAGLAQISHLIVHLMHRYQCIILYK